MCSEKQSKIIHKKLRKGQFITIKPNKNFLNFHEESKKYFNSNFVPHCTVNIVLPPGEGYSVIGKSIRKPQYIIQIFAKGIGVIDFYPHKDGIELQKLDMFQKGQGYGTKFMKAFIQIAKDLNIKIYLIPMDIENNPADPKEDVSFTTDSILEG